MTDRPQAFAGGAPSYSLLTSLLSPAAQTNGGQAEAVHLLDRVLSQKVLRLGPIPNSPKGYHPLQRGESPQQS